MQNEEEEINPDGVEMKQNFEGDLHDIPDNKEEQEDEENEQEQVKVFIFKLTNQYH